MTDDTQFPDDRSDAVYTCDECDSFVDPTTWTPVEGVVNDGSVEIYRFCDEDCRESWSDE